MGIDKDRFIGDHHQVFLCPVCKDVSSSPILSDCCESTFCDDCWTRQMSEPSDKCPSCNRSNDPIIGKKSFQKQLTLLYNNLQIKCKERSCGEVLTLKNYIDHDSTCPLRKFHCFRCGYKGKMFDTKDHDCVRWLKQERNQLLEKNLELSVKLKNATSKASEVNVPIHDEEVDRVLKENVELKKSVQKLSDELNEVTKERDCLLETFNSTVKMLNLPKKGPKLLNGNADPSELEKLSPSTSRCMTVMSSSASTADSGVSTMSSGMSTSSRVSSPPPPLFSSSLPPITLARECDLKKETKVVFVEEATRARKDVRQKVSAVVVDVFKSNANQGINIQRKCLEVSKELKKSLTGSWYTFPRNHFNPQGFRPFINTFCLFHFEGRYYVSFQNNGPVEEKSKFLNHYLRFK